MNPIKQNTSEVMKSTSSCKIKRPIGYWHSRDIYYDVHCDVVTITDRCSTARFPNITWNQDLKIPITLKYRLSQDIFLNLDEYHNQTTELESLISMLQFEKSITIILNHWDSRSNRQNWMKVKLKLKRHTYVKTHFSVSLSIPNPSKRL